MIVRLCPNCCALSREIKDTFFHATLTKHLKLRVLRGQPSLALQESNAFGERIHRHLRRRRGGQVGLLGRRHAPRVLLLHEGADVGIEGLQSLQPGLLFLCGQSLAGRSPKTTLAPEWESKRILERRLQSCLQTLEASVSGLVVRDVVPIR